MQCQPGGDFPSILGGVTNKILLHKTQLVSRVIKPQVMKTNMTKSWKITMFLYVFHRTIHLQMLVFPWSSLVFGGVPYTFQEIPNEVSAIQKWQINRQTPTSHVCPKKYNQLYANMGPEKPEVGAHNSIDFGVKNPQLPMYFRPFMGAP